MTQMFVPYLLRVLIVLQVKDKQLGIEKCEGNSLPALGPFARIFQTLDPA